MFFFFSPVPSLIHSAAPWPTLCSVGLKWLAGLVLMGWAGLDGFSAQSFGSPGQTSGVYKPPLNPSTHSLISLRVTQRAARVWLLSPNSVVDYACEPRRSSFLGAVCGPRCAPSMVPPPVRAPLQSQLHWHRLTKRTIYTRIPCPLKNPFLVLVIEWQLRWTNSVYVRYIED